MAPRRQTPTLTINSPQAKSAGYAASPPNVGDPTHITLVSAADRPLKIGITYERAIPLQNARPRPAPRVSRRPAWADARCRSPAHEPGS